MAHLAGAHQVGHRAHGVLDRHLAVHPMLVVQVDVVHTQPLQAGVAGGAHVLWSAVDAEESAVGRAHAAELGCEHHLVAARRQQRRQQALVGPHAVHVCGVEEIDADVQRVVQHGQ
jgi:hypothetical protein